MHDLWKDMFVLAVPLLEKILRPVIVYVFLIVGLRVAGKRELAQLNPFDLVVLLTLSNTVQNAIIGDDNSVTGGIIGAISLLAVNYVVVRFLYDHHKLEEIVEGSADVLIEDGCVHEDRLKRELITKEELEAAARRQGLESFALHLHGLGDNVKSAARLNSANGDDGRTEGRALTADQRLQCCDQVC